MVAITAVPVSAKTLNMGTDGTDGNYYAMGQDIQSYCADIISTDLNVAETTGSVSNLLGMMNKEYSLCIVQEDVLNYNAKRNPKKVNQNRIKILTGLHEEAVHLLIPKGYQPKTNESKSLWSKFGLGNDDQLKKFELSMLKGQEIGSWGWKLSAEALGYFFGLNIHVTEVKNKGDVNDVSKPLVLVGGAPYKVVQDYLASGKWTLAALNYDAISQQASFYSKQNVNYQIGGKVRSEPTVGVRALLLGKSFRKKSRNEPMTELATCIYQNVADLADDPDTNPNWGTVYDYIDGDGQFNWAYFPLDESKLEE
ncbi:TAXI family TRAP transporter solute-binding subunit [Vibrio rotiferianus]